MRFGYHSSSFRYDGHEGETGVDSVVAFAQRLEGEGFDWFSVMDHLWQLPFVGERDDPFFDCYTLLPAIARATDEIEVSALVTSPHYRNPAMLGRILTTLDHVSDGRAVLGIGAGWFEEEYDAYGFEFPEPAKRVSQMADTVELVRAMWTEESPVTYRGEHHEIEDLILEPKPVRDPHPPILIGGGGEQLTLRAVARRADRWNAPGLSPDAYEHKLDVLADHCEDVGRDYDDIEKTALQSAVIRETTDAAHEAYERLKRDTDAGVRASRDEYRGLVGTPAEVAERIERFEELGVETVMVWAEQNDPETVDRLVDDVVPQFR